MNEDVRRIFSPRTIRERAGRILALAEGGGTGFRLNLARLPACADLVAATCRENYPSLAIPFHSRWRHFGAGGVDRAALLERELERRGVEAGLERTRSKIDLVVTSVLLDAGAGPEWRYREPGTGGTYSRSEGLAVASFHLFLDGAFSSDILHPLRADAHALARLSDDVLAAGFQAGSSNPLEGLAGRALLMRNLGAALSANPRYFGTAPPRPGHLVDFFMQGEPEGERKVSATEVLEAIQRGLGPIWPGRVSLGGVNLGDVWPYPPLGEGVEGLVPFHKLSQWLTYSMLETLAQAGIGITGVEELTGLPEYRNGGLLLDTGVLELRDPGEASRDHEPSSERVVEWRALTVALLDRLAPLVRERLGRGELELPLAAILEGGTWAAGRKIAREKRPGGAPPLRIRSDGTVF